MCKLQRAYIFVSIESNCRCDETLPTIGLQIYKKTFVGMSRVELCFLLSFKCKLDGSGGRITVKKVNTETESLVKPVLFREVDQ